MDDEAFLAALEREGQALATAAENHLARPIPPVDGWTVADVVEHTGSGDRWTLGILEGLSGHDALARLQDAPSGPALIDWFRAGQVELLTALTAVDPEAMGWTLNGDRQRLGVWRRRRAQETAVHRWDVESAAGPPRPIADDLAADGIDEMFEVFIPRFPAEKLAGHGETLHLHAADEAGSVPERPIGEWTVTFGPDGITMVQEHAKGDAAARGSASDLLLFLWGRVPPSRLEVFGDASLLDRWQSTVKI